MKKLWVRLKQTRRWKKIFLSIFLCLSLLILTLSALVSTEAGSHWVVNKAANTVNLKLGQLKGNLLTGLDIASADYQQNGLDVHVEKISFRWQPLSLFYTAVSVQSLSAENIRVHLLPSEKTPEPDIYEWPSLAQPVRVELDSVRLRNVRVQQGEHTYNLNALNGSVSLGTFHLRVKDLNAVNEQASLLINGEMGLRYPYSFKLHSEWASRTSASEPTLNEELLVFAGKLTAMGDIKTINVQQELLQPNPIKATAKVSPALHDKKSSPIAEIVADWPEQALLPILAERFNPDGSLHWLKPIKTTQGHLELRGWLNAYDVKSSVQAKTADAKLVIDLIGKGTQSADFNEAQLQLQKLQLTASPLEANDADAKPENFLALSGNIHLLPHIYWDVKLQGEHFNLDNFVADWPSDLHLSLDSQGEYRAQQLKLWVNNINAGGELRNLAVAADGEFHFDGNYWNSSNFKLAVGANQLMLKGQLGKTLAVEWKINAPLLGQIDPGISGSIISNGTLSGDIEKPNMQVSAQINQFSWRDYGAENLSLKLNSQAATDKYNLLLDADHVRIQSQYLSRVSIKGDGNITQHAVTGQVESPAYGDITFGLSSSWKDNIWHGQWTSFTFNTKKIPRWSLLSGTPMQADKDHADLGKLCLTTNNELPVAIDPVPATAALQKAPLIEQPSVCASGDWNRANGINANINIKAAPLSSLRAWFKPEVNLSGVLEGDLAFRAPVNTPPVMTANLQTRDAKLLYQFQGGNVEVYPLQKASATATLKNNQLNAALAMDWGSYGSVNAESQYSIANEKIQGSANIALTNLAPLEGLLPFLNNVQGSASGKFNVAGTSSKPEFTGNFNITGGSANLPKLGLELKNISFQVTSPSVNSAHVEGSITSGDGTLVTQGDFINLGAPDWYWKANVFGAGIRIIQQTDLAATISPNLKLSANAQSIELTGSTEIPWARAAIKNLPESAIRVSHDVVIVEKDSLSVEALKQKTLPFHTNVILYFGDDVRFKGFGLDTRLSGKANVIKEENRQVFTTGYVAVDKGVYKAYGQELSVERGRLIFQGPYDNPGLDIRAVRVTDDTVTAGLDIGGTLQHPKSTVFAIPAKTDSEAMAILLTGKSLSNSSKDDAYAIIGAIGKLGMSQGDSMTSDIVHKFGLDEVSIKADKGIEQSELWVGKYVTPKLFLHYVVGLFDQAFSLGLTYKVNDKVQVEAESGKTQSVDVIYKIER